MRSLREHLHPMVALAPAIVADNTVQNGLTIDRRNYESLLFLIALGTLADADATFAVKLQHGDLANASDMADCAAVDMDDTVASASFQFDDDAECRKLAYVGNKRYVRLVVTPANNSGNAPLAAIAVGGNAKVRPTPTL